MPHLPPAHHETSKCDSRNETKVKEKNETILDSNSNIAKSMTHHNQTKELTTWFLNDLYRESGKLAIGVLEIWTCPGRGPDMSGQSLWNPTWGRICPVRDLVTKELG
jgi:hypothetical protein